ncbi:MAG: AsnC family transcriptional regulator, partial [Acidobacteria bacterium]|nr:AsnC family transcriptional regulator [Acidobacteriota bacterium]
MQLDRIDCKIVEALQNNGRLSNKELAARVGVAPSTCLLRVRRLQEGGALRGFYTSFDSQSLGV